MAKAICITGMHRSGTSLITSWLQECGLHIHNGNLMGSGVGNPKGHFEDIDFFELQSNAILKKFPCSNGWKVYSNNQIEFTANQIEKAKSIVDERNSNFSSWGWKDPRSVLFLNSWKEIIPDLKVIIIWRPCSDVVSSLLRRSIKKKNKIDRITIFEAINVWLHYNKKSIQYKEKYPSETLLIPHIDFLNKDKEVFVLFKSKLTEDVKYFSLNNIFDPNLMNIKSKKKIYGLIDFLPDVKATSKRLSDISDLKR